MRMRRSFTRILIAVFASSLLFQGIALADGGKGKFPKEHRELLGGSSDAWLFGKDDADEISTGSSEEEEELQVGPNVRVNAPQQAFPNGLLGRSETTVASREDGRFIVVGFNDAQGFCGAPFGSACTPQTPSGLSGYAFSTDGGLTFTDGGAPDPARFGNVFTRGDPWLDRGGKDKKTFFYANLAVDASTGVDLGVSVHRGRFRGRNFAWEDVHVLAPPRGEVRDFYDKEAIAVDREGRGIVSVTNFQELCGIQQNGFGQIEVWRTNDGGDTWVGPAIAGPEAADSVAACGNTGTLQQSSVPAIGPEGEVYVVWQFGPTFTATATSTNAQIRVARSLNGGASFDTPVTVASINSFRQDVPVGYNRSRINDHPRISVVTKGEHEGRVVVAFYSAGSPVGAAPIIPCPPGTPPPPQPNQGTTFQNRCFAQQLTSSQVFVSHSDDRGATWSTRVPIAPAPSASGLKRFWPVVTTNDDGNVNAVFTETREAQATENPSDTECNVNLGQTRVSSTLVFVNRRAGLVSSLVDIFVSQSTDGGSTFGAPVRVSTATSNWCTAASNIRPNFGDYIGAFQDGDRVLATWGDSRNGPVDTFFAPIEEAH